MYVPVDSTGSDAESDLCSCECSPGEREGTICEETREYHVDDHYLRCVYMGGEIKYGAESCTYMG